MTHTKVLAVLGVATLMVFSGCSLLTGTKKQEAVKFALVNILDKQYFDDCHIEGSVNVPFGDLVAYAQKNWDKEQTQIVVYCANYKCSASAAAWRQLDGLGYQHVWAYEGGTAEAQKDGLAVVGACTQGYLEDLEKPTEEHLAEGQKPVNVISLDELKAKIAEFAAK